MPIKLAVIGHTASTRSTRLTQSDRDDVQEVPVTNKKFTAIQYYLSELNESLKVCTNGELLEFTIIRKAAAASGLHPKNYDVTQIDYD